MMTHPKRVCLTFSDFIDLQTRLLLLPRIEEEGHGAVVSSYQHPEETNENEFNGIVTTNSEDAKTESEKSDATGPVKEESQERGGTEKEKQETEESPMETNLAGYVLVGVGSAVKEQSENTPSSDLREQDFTSILSSIREQPTPIVLFLDPPEAITASKNTSKDDEKSSGDDDSSSTTASSTSTADLPIDVEEDTCSPPSNTEATTKGFLGEWSAWGSRMAAEAASGAASLSSAVAVAAAEAKERRAKAQAAQEAAEKEKKPSSSEVCSLFLQTSSGVFLPVDDSTSATRSSERKVTTASVLSVRQSVVQPCPMKGYSFQWYRSGGNEEEHPSGWVPLEGATHSVFQPSATEVGHRVRCLVTIESEDTSPDDYDDMNDDDSSKLAPQLVECETPQPVAADLSLFNGARQALVRGARFGGLVGRGNAEGRQFQVNIEIARVEGSNRKSGVASALTIYQVSGSTVEPMHSADHPILKVGAWSDPSQPKNFDFILPPNLPDSAEMVKALSTDGRFQVTAPNRIARESLLLAMGIANYKGKPADLDATTILFRGTSPDDDKSCSTNSTGSPCSIPGSCHSTNGSIISASSRSFQSSCASSSPDTTLIGSHVGADCEDAVANGKIAELEQELRLMRAKLARKDKVVSELQRQVTRCDSDLEKEVQAHAACQEKLQKKTEEVQNCREDLRLAEKRNDSHHLHTSTLEDRIVAQSEQIAQLEKSVRSLQNEKAVLTAAVEARESKLSKMADLQKSFDTLSTKVAQHDALRVELTDTSERYQEVCKDLDKAANAEKACRAELEETRAREEQLKSRLDEESKRRKACSRQMELAQKKNHMLMAERNSFKQKFDSLSKEISRICRDGRTLEDVEKSLEDEAAHREEISNLKRQKHKALEELEFFRTAYQQARAAQEKAGIDSEAMRALEQKEELQRLLSELTEYVDAKEMQLETLKQVNEALQEEIHRLAQASMSRNDV